MIPNHRFADTDRFQFVDEEVAERLYGLPPDEAEAVLRQRACDEAEGEEDEGEE